MNKENYIDSATIKILYQKGFKKDDYLSDYFILFEIHKWLQQNKGIYIDITVYSKFEWGYTIFLFDEKFCTNIEYNDEIYKSYEEAFINGILKVLNYI